MLTSISQVQEFITYLRNTGVSSFEGFGLKMEFNHAAPANPFSIEDPAERRKAVMEAFQAQTKSDEEDLYYSAT